MKIKPSHKSLLNKLWVHLLPSLLHLDGVSVCVRAVISRFDSLKCLLADFAAL